MSSNLAPSYSPRSGQFGAAKNKHSVLRVIAAVRSGVIFLHVNCRVADGSNRTPEESAEVNDQIRRNVAHILVEFLWA